MNKAVIVAENLKKRFGDFKAVDGVSFTVYQGEVFGFLGPNGAGKTTTMKMLQCTSPKSGGRLEVLGMEVDAHQRQIKSRLGVMPQETNLDPDFTVKQNLLVYARYFDIPGREAEQRAEELIDFLQLSEKKHTVIDLLSGGMKRRLLLARALINNPELLILDEPTLGLDPQARHLLWDKIKSLRQQGITVVLTTHYLEEAERLCDRLVIMDYGRILVEGRPSDIVREHIGTDIVETENTEEARACFEKQGAHFEVAGESLQVYTEHPEEVTGALLEECELGSITVRRATLEDVFLKLTGKKLRE